MEEEGDSQWHLNKKVIVGLICGLISVAGAGFAQGIYQTYLITSWKTITDDRISALEKSDDSQQSHEKRLTILEQQFDYIRADLAEIKTLLRRQIPPAQ